MGPFWSISQGNRYYLKKGIGKGIVLAWRTVLVSCYAGSKWKLLLSVVEGLGFLPYSHSSTFMIVRIISVVAHFTKRILEILESSNPDMLIWDNKLESF